MGPICACGMHMLMNKAFVPRDLGDKVSNGFTASPLPIENIGTQKTSPPPPSVFAMNIKTKELRAHFVLRISI
jgi:hypothetical protein